MYIAPNSTIRILQNVPLDPTYDHTIYFISREAQISYFTGKTKYTLNNQSYQRLQRGWMRVSILSDNLYDCNYIMFQNTSYGNKWFYAFIKKVEYINDNVSEIEFEIDVMQTWHFDYQPETCFVEREHTFSDELFENIVEENIEIGTEYVCKVNQMFNMNDQYVCILHSRKPTASQITYDSKTINGVYSPIRILGGLDPSNPRDIDAWLDTLYEDDIVAVYQYPKFLTPVMSGSPIPDQIEYPVNPVVEDFQLNPSFQYIDGYAPKNKKLFCYPYNFLQVSNNCGQSANYRWEDWREQAERFKFKICGTMSTTPVVICYPYKYRSILHDYDEGITYSNFPTCAWAGDTFKAWWAQNKNSYTTGIVCSALNGVVSAISGGIIGSVKGGALGAGVGVAEGLVSAGTQIATSVAKMNDIKNAPNTTFGQVQLDALNLGLHRTRFDFYQLCIRRDYARIVDDYFTRYGYACKENKLPNRNARPHWTYTKTLGCTITGSIPADDARKICDIYNNGITFWANGDEVGNYTLDNSPEVI